MVNSSFVYLINFGNGGQVIALKSAAAFMLDSPAVMACRH
jgi:hypothetical protein